MLIGHPHGEEAVLTKTWGVRVASLPWGPGAWGQCGRELQLGQAMPGVMGNSPEVGRDRRRGDSPGLPSLSTWESVWDMNPFGTCTLDLPPCAVDCFLVPFQGWPPSHMRDSVRQQYSWHVGGFRIGSVSMPPASDTSSHVICTKTLWGGCGSPTYA